MAKTPETDTSKPHATHLDRKGWFWVVRSGNRVIYHGPYHSKHAAEMYHEDVDTYCYDGGGK